MKAKDLELMTRLRSQEIDIIIDKTNYYGNQSKYVYCKNIKFRKYFLNEFREIEILQGFGDDIECIELADGKKVELKDCLLLSAF
jgi:hypothetical protein